MFKLYNREHKIVKFKSIDEIIAKTGLSYNVARKLIAGEKMCDGEWKSAHINQKKKVAQWIRKSAVVHIKSRVLLIPTGTKSRDPIIKRMGLKTFDYLMLTSGQKIVRAGWTLRSTFEILHDDPNYQEINYID